MINTHVTTRHISEYADLAGPETLRELRRLAMPLSGLRVLHLSASPFGSAAADTLSALVPLQRDLGLAAEWRWVGETEPVQLWRRIYRGLAGDRVEWSGRERRTWELSLRREAAATNWDYDVIVVHDPQLLPLPQILGASSNRTMWIWHCHLDPRHADDTVRDALASPLEWYNAGMFPEAEMTPPWVRSPQRAVAPAALDPLAPRNRPVSAARAKITLEQLGLDPARPIIGQFAPIDARFSPLAAIGAYWMARQHLPGLQLVLAETTPVALDAVQNDEERVRHAAFNDANIHLLPASAGLGAQDLSALKQAVSVVMQMSVPHGFGWGLAEAQWKGKPAIVGRYGMLPDQAAWGRAGYVVEGAPGAASALLRLLNEPDLAAALGRQGKARITERHLITNLLKEYLLLLQRLLAGELVSPWATSSLVGHLDPAG